MGMQRTLNLQNRARLTRVSKVMALRTLNHHLATRSTMSAHILSPYMIPIDTITFLSSNQLALL